MSGEEGVGRHGRKGGWERWREARREIEMERGKEGGRNGGSSDKHKPALFQHG